MPEHVPPPRTRWDSLRDGHAIQSLIVVLKSDNEKPSLRGHAAEALGNIGDVCAVASLIARLKDRSVEVRFWSVFALGQIGDPRALPMLERTIADDKGVLDGCGSIKREASDAGTAAGYAWDVGMAVAVPARAAGYKVKFNCYPKAKGVGMTVAKKGERCFGIDWYQFKAKSGKMVNRPHGHWGPTKTQIRKHRSLRTGKPM